jgi:hypothetical protein
MNIVHLFELLFNNLNFLTLFTCILLFNLHFPYSIINLMMHFFTSHDLVKFCSILCVQVHFF